MGGGGGFCFTYSSCAAFFSRRRLWTSFRDATIPSLDCQNVPMDGWMDAQPGIDPAVVTMDRPPPPLRTITQQQEKERGGG